MIRKQKSFILKDLSKKIVFIVGPRQVGKTWLAKDIASGFPNSVYLNYDRLEDRTIIKNESWRDTTELLILDELHKMPLWKNYLKGIYDTKPMHLKIIVTGSARLDILRQVDDSLAGRFFIHHLFPFSPTELQHTSYSQDIDRFIFRGGFPEPFLADDPVEADRWRAQYVDSLLRTDILEFSHIDHLHHMQLVFELLRSKVGSPISYQSLSEDIGISPNTVKKYIRVLESLYIVFRVTPFAKNIARSLMKMPKIYFFDVGMVKGETGAKLENFAALCLLKHVYAIRDYQGKNYNLHYVRTKEGMEIDFALVDDESIEQVLEIKTQDKTVNNFLSAFQKKYHCKAAKLVYELRQEKTEQGVDVLKLGNFLRSLVM